jgi:hypothetical protein
MMQSTPESTPTKRGHTTRNVLLGIVGGVALSGVLCCGLGMVLSANGSTATSGATTPKSTVAGSPVAVAPAAVIATPDDRPVLSSAEVFRGWDALTAIQKPDYEKSVLGRRISDTGRVSEVYESGYVLVTVPGGGALQRVTLYDLPKPVLAGLAKDQTITFDGTIRRFNNLLGQTIEVRGTQITG